MTAVDVVYALKRQGKTIFGFGESEIILLASLALAGSDLIIGEL